ncbi:2-oxo-tetronate isomerase [Xylophilus sp.]|uniref:2-oxo-tetronate isomerase n=1 Tax=Xylophilus sp. TaxID=2653893 RepID=UPI0013BC59AC|nr:2-oxo-tetronate isomerase [Xylophilus sp.]KAF1046637.1 MAG: 2-oxo-tetronate isomerase [Xylophilus sp.]
MPCFAVNLSFLYTELPFLDRFAAAAQDGFGAVEFLSPYGIAPAEIAARLRDHALELVLFNTPPSGATLADAATAWERPDRGTAALPGREAEFRAGIRLALDHAERLGTPRIHVLAGLAPPGADTVRLRATYVANLQWAAAEARLAGRTLLIEPINGRDMPGYLLQRQDDAHALLDAVGVPNLQVQMDLYHCQVTEGDVAIKLRRWLPTGRVGHLQIAGVPERHEPDRGELHHPYLFELIDQLGYGGWIGCEYRPAAGTRAGLGWLHAADTRRS